MMTTLHHHGTIILVWAVISALSFFCSRLLSQSASLLRPLDYPNPRSLHGRPVPRSGGLAILGAFLVALAVARFAGLEVLPLRILVPALIVAVVSFAEDMRRVPALLRLTAHFLAGAVLLIGGMPLGSDIVPGLVGEWPAWAVIPVTLLFVAWMTNLYNFMDGVDGLAAGMGVIGFGTLAWFGHVADNPRYAFTAAAIASSCAGFLALNWAPARIFMGDLGATFLGFMAAAMALWGRREGILAPWAWFLTFSPFIADASMTLLRRAASGEKWWRAHNSHYYQRLVLLGYTHRQVSLFAFALMLSASLTAVYLQGKDDFIQWSALGLCFVAYAVVGIVIGSIERNRPWRDELLPFHIPDIGEAEIESVVESLRSGWLTTGPKVKRFEKNFARYLGGGQAVAVNSCTAALHLALDAIGIREDDEVLVPTFTFAATAEVVSYFKAKPVLVDCRPDDLNIDPAQLEKAVTRRTKAVMPVHVGGSPCDMDSIRAVARRHGLRVIEDAAHALPTRYKGRLVGTISDITCFSFYATKTITTGEGGMITTDDVELADRMRIMSLHGISRDAWKRYTAEGSWRYEILYPGFKYNLTDPAAAIGIEQLKRCDELWRVRSSHAKLYTEGLQNLPELECPKEPKEGQHAWHLYAVKLNLDRLRIGRDEFIEELKRRGIGTSVHFIPLHLHPHYRETFGYTPESFPVASAAFNRIVSLPIYTKMSKMDVERVIDNIRGVLVRNRR